MMNQANRKTNPKFAIVETAGGVSVRAQLKVSIDRFGMKTRVIAMFLTIVEHDPKLLTPPSSSFGCLATTECYQKLRLSTDFG